jgi:hypothetical protein
VKPPVLQSAVFVATSWENLSTGLNRATADALETGGAERTVYVMVDGYKERESRAAIQLALTSGVRIMFYKTQVNGSKFAKFACPNITTAGGDIVPSRQPTPLHM